MTMQANSRSDGDNPTGTDGFEFIEYATPEPGALAAEFERMGFAAVARHRSKDVQLYRQGSINLIINAEPDSMTESFAALDRPAICAMAFRVTDATAAYRRVLSLGTWEATAQAGVMELRLAAISGVGDTVIYLIDRYGDRSIYDVDFHPLTREAGRSRELGLAEVDHVVHTVEPGRSREWGDFYRHLFNFRISAPAASPGERFTVISPCGRIRIRIEETGPASGQARPGSGPMETISRVGLTTADIVATVQGLRERGVDFEEVDPVRQQAALARLPDHQGWLDELARQGIAPDPWLLESGELLLRARTRSAVGPVSFELVQREVTPG